MAAGTTCLLSLAVYPVYSRLVVHPTILVASRGGGGEEGDNDGVLLGPSVLSPPMRDHARADQKQKSPKNRHAGVATGDGAGEVTGDETAGAGVGAGAGAGAGAGVGQRPKRDHGHTMGVGGDAVTAAAVGNAVAGAAVGEEVADAATADGDSDGDREAVAGSATGGVDGSMGT